jgi:hypothetical protein
MANRTAHIHQDRVLKIQELIPVEFSDGDLNWIVDWLLAIGLGTVNSALAQNPKLTLHDLFILTTKLPNDISH